MTGKNLRNRLVILTVLLAASSLSGCGPAGKILSAIASKQANQTEQAEETAEKDNEAEKEGSEKKEQKKKDKNKKKNTDETELTEDIYKEDASEVFSEMSEWAFVFSSGAGGWMTEMRVDPDGTFYGQYYDNDMGDTGDGYENGTRYECNFSGKFSQNVRSCGPLMHSLSVESIDYEQKPGKEEIKDGVKIIYTGPYGLDGIDKQDNYDAPFVFMEAGAVTSALNQDELDWLSPTHFGNYVGENWDYVEDTPEFLPFAALINTVEEEAFFAFNNSQKNKVHLVNKVKLPGLHNVEAKINRDGTYSYVDENEDGSFRVISKCYKTNKHYDVYDKSDELVNDALKEIYGKNAPDSENLYVTSPKEAYTMQYPEMVVNGEYTASAFWYPTAEHYASGSNSSGRFLALDNYEGDTSFVYAYIIEYQARKDKPSFPDGAMANCYITSLMLTGRDDGISSAGEGKGAVRDLNCDMKLPEKDLVEAKTLIMVGSGDKDLIKKYHLENASFDDDYEIVAPEKDYRTYKLAQGGYTPFYVQYPEDGFHRLFYANEFDEYMNRWGDDPENTCLMYLYLNEDNEVVYGYEEYVP